MGRAEEMLWRAALRRPWSKRPTKADVDVIASAIAVHDTVHGVFRLSWSMTSSSALVITSRAVMIGGARPVRPLQDAVSQVPAEFRLGASGLAIPRQNIRKVVATAERIVLHTDRQPIVLTRSPGATLDRELEAALTELTAAPPAPSGSSSEVATEARARREAARQMPRDDGLWNGRYLQGGAIRIERRAALAPERGVTAALESAGRAWRSLPTWGQWLLGLGVFFGLQTVATPSGVLFVVLLVVFLAMTGEEAAEKRRARLASPEAELAAADWIEGRVASAACRAWEETLREPSWSSPALEATRATFDGDQEVDAIIDLALRIHQARDELGPMPTGPALKVWQQQVVALDAAALRLGGRADALIRHRDQAAKLSHELAQLAELERLERSALVVDDLTIATSMRPGSGGLTPVSDDIAAARGAVRDLIELMTRTLAPLAEPI